MTCSGTVLIVIGMSRTGRLVLPVAAVPSSAPWTVTSSTTPAIFSVTVRFVAAPTDTDCVDSVKPGARTSSVYSPGATLSIEKEPSALERAAARALAAGTRYERDFGVGDARALWIDDAPGHRGGLRKERRVNEDDDGEGREE